MEWVHYLQQTPTQSIRLRAYGCPLVDSCSLGRPFSGAWVPYFAVSQLDGLNLDPDAVNSVCYGNTFEDCQHEGVAPPSLSEVKVPADGSAIHCSSVSNSVPSNNTCAINDSNELKARAATAGIPQHLSSNTIHYRRNRQLQAETYGNIASAQGPVYIVPLQVPQLSCTVEIS